MSKKNLIFLLAIVLIMVVLVVVFKNRKNKSNVDEEIQHNSPIVTNTVKNEVTGETQYILYNKDSGNVITVLNEAEQYKAKIYELDPDYEELEVLTENEKPEESYGIE